MKNNLFRIIFSSGLQAIAVQILGVAFIAIIADHLSKDNFGIISWANALSMMITILISFGMDQVVVRRIAASKTSDWTAAAYLIHALIGSVAVFCVLFLLVFFLKDDSVRLAFLPWFFAAQAITYIGGPLKHYLNAKQRFAPYGIIATFTNSLKIVLAFYLISRNNLAISTVVVIMIVCAAIELAGLLVFVFRKTGFRIKFKTRAYTKLVKESLPQYVSVIFDSSLSRMDWILLGILGTAAATAEYSVASRAFEVARLPIAIIAPILLARFAPILMTKDGLNAEKKELVVQLFTVEMFLVMLIPLVANILWSPILDSFFKGKYGSVNATQFMLLSLCIPTQFFINLLWTLTFASKRYKQTSIITIYSAITNVLLSLLLIPSLGGLGTAISFLITSILQLTSYYILVRRDLMSIPLKPILAFFMLAAASYYIAISTTGSVFLQLLISLTIYMCAALLLRLVQKKHIHTVKSFIRK